MMSVDTFNQVLDLVESISDEERLQMKMELGFH